MNYDASMTTTKGMSIACRILDPAQAKWWTGSAWGGEGAAAMTPLAATVLSNPYEDLYTGAVILPAVAQRLILEYIDQADGMPIGTDTIEAAIALTISPEQTTTIADTVAAAVNQGLDPLAATVTGGAYPAGTAGDAISKLIIPNDPATVIPIPAPVVAGTCQVYADLRDFGLEPKSGVAFTAKPAKTPQIVGGLLIDVAPQTKNTDDTGRVIFTLAKGTSWLIASAVLPAEAKVSTLDEDAINVVSVMI